MKGKRILVLAPHADDAELGCGGSLARLIDNGNEVYHVVFSLAEKSVPDGFPKDIHDSEVRKALKILGIDEKNLIVHRFEVRTFYMYRHKLLDEMIGLENDIQPDLIFLPSSSDCHQDHAAVHDEGIRAFKKLKLLGYEMPWNNMGFRADAFIPLEDSQIEKKIQAVKCYESVDRNYMSEGFIKSLASVRGTQIDVKYAEAFEVLRWIVD